MEDRSMLLWKLAKLGKLMPRIVFVISKALLREILHLIIF
jgi:hypothetical protein